MFGSCMRQYDQKLETTAPPRGAAAAREIPPEELLKTALAEANIYVFRQDADLRYTWVYGPQADGDGLTGRTDEELLPSREREAVVAVKQRVLQTAMPADCEVSYALPEGRKLFALHVHPTFGPDRKVTGITTTATDISRVRSLES